MIFDVPPLRVCELQAQRGCQRYMTAVKMHFCIKQGGTTSSIVPEG